MTAPAFVRDLCGYRSGGNPNTSDANDPGSITWGKALFAELGVTPGQPEPRGKIGKMMEDAIITELSSWRPDLDIQPGQSIARYQQYLHLGVFPEFSSATRGGYVSMGERFAPLSDVAGLSRQAQRALDQSMIDWRHNDELVTRLRNAMPDESVLNLDITVSSLPPAHKESPPRLLAGFSSKWTLRTDRGQDPITHGNKMSALRRGPMPHYALITLEPRSAMLALVAEGSGAVDCVYHLALDELLAAGADLARQDPRHKRKPYERLLRLVEQGRIRAWNDLVAEITYLPNTPVPTWVHRGPLVDSTEADPQP